MPRLPIPRGMGAPVRGAAPARIAPPVNPMAGLQEIGRTAGQMAQQQFRADQQQKDIDARGEIAANQEAAAQIAEYERQYAAEQKALQEREEARDKLSAGNAALQYELNVDAINRDLQGKLKAGEIDATEYQGKYQSALRSMQSTLANDLTTGARVLFEQGAAQSNVKATIKARDTLQTHIEEQTLGELTANVENLERLAVGNLDQALAAGSQLFSAEGPYAQIKGADDAAKAGAQFKERATLAHFRSQVANAANSPGALQELRKAVAGNGNMDPMQQAAMTTSIDSRIQVLDNRRQAAIAKQERAAKVAVDSLEKLSEGGFPIAPAYLSKVASQAQGTPHAARVGEIMKAAADNAAFGSMSVPQMDATVQQMAAQAGAEGVTPEQAAKLSKLMKIRDAAAKDYAADPWQAAADRGQIEAIPPVDHTTPQGITESLMARMSVLDDVEQAAGRPVSPLQPKEAEAVGRVLQAMPAPERAAMLGEMAGAIGQDRMMTLAGQLQANDQTLGVVAAATAQGLKTADGQSLGTLILKGAEAIDGKRVKVDDAAGEGIQAEMREYLGDAIASPVARDAAVAAAIKVWAASEAEGLGMDYQDALESVSGVVVDHAGRRTLAPTGWTADEFERSLSSLTSERITEQAGGRTMYVDGVALDAGALTEQIESMQLQQGSGNRYMMLSGGVPVTDQDRNPIYIELEKPGPAPGLWDRIFGGD